jgi:hypothetical protein
MDPLTNALSVHSARAVCPSGRASGGPFAIVLTSRRHSGQHPWRPGASKYQKESGNMLKTITCDAPGVVTTAPRRTLMASACTAVLGAALLLTGCGGGGGGGDDNGGSGGGSGGTGGGTGGGGTGGTVTLPGGATLSTPSLTFSAEVGTASQPQTVTLKNDSSTVLPISGVSTGSGAFSVAGGTCATTPSLAVGDSCSVDVAFRPNEVGTASGSLTIGTGAAPVQVSLTGSATPFTGPDLVTSVTAPTYPAGSVEKGAWDVLMAARSTCGFGLVQQDARLDTASAAHAVYLAQNSVDRNTAVLGPAEDPTWNYFTGVSPVNRAAAAGFPAGVGVAETSVGLVFAYNGTTQSPPLQMTEATGARTMRTVLESIYNVGGLLNAGRVGGIAAASRSGPSSGSQYLQQVRLVAEFSENGKAQRLGAGNVATWPCEGVGAFSGVFLPATESPNPFPDLAGQQAVFGTPIYMRADPDVALVLTSGTVTNVATGTAIATRTLTRATDPNGRVGNNEAFLIPTSALPAGNSFRVQVSGTVGGRAFTRTFTFSTAT